MEARKTPILVRFGLCIVIKRPVLPDELSDNSCTVVSPLPNPPRVIPTFASHRRGDSINETRHHRTRTAQNPPIRSRRGGEKCRYDTHCIIRRQRLEESKYES